MLEDEGKPAPVEGSEPAATESTPTTPTPTVTPTVTPDETAALKARLEEKESFIGRQSAEVGTLRNEVGYLRSMVEQSQAGRQQVPVEQRPPETARTKINWDDPDGSISRLVEERIQASESQRQKQDMERRASEARSNFYEGKDAAYKTDKRLYEGIEGRVEQALYESYRSGILNERSLANPKTWQRAAQLIRLEGGEYDRLQPPAVQPTRPTQTETPQGRPISTEEVSVEIDDETRRWGRGQGLTDKQIEELIEREMKATSQGLNKTVFRR